jgi:hypothetical protein
LPSRASARSLCGVVWRQCPAKRTMTTQVLMLPILVPLAGHPRH